MSGIDAQWADLSSSNERVAGAADAAAGRTAGAAGRSAAGSLRRGRRGRRAVLAAAGTAVLASAGTSLALPAEAAVAHPVPAPAAGWRIVKQVHDGPLGVFTAVTAAGRSGGWAFSGVSGATAWQRSGDTWRKVPFPGGSGSTVVAAGASSASNVWAFTGNAPHSRALRWNGRHWSVRESFTGAITGAAVLSRADVWVFGAPAPGAAGTWHFNGRSWSRVSSGRGLVSGSALRADSVWAFGGSRVAHWNGRDWSRTSVQRLLPARRLLNDPAVTAIYAQSRRSVWAVGDGNRQDEGGPLVILHYNGRSWSRVARAAISGYPAESQLAPDGHGGLWIPVGPSAGGTTAELLHYSGGHLRAAALPVASNKIDVLAIAAIPHPAGVLAVGFTHSARSLAGRIAGVILRFGR